jgi:fibronectin-binding autotransporter adhesin
MKNPSTTYLTRVLPAAALFALSAMPAAMAQTVFSYGSSDFNLSANWGDGLPGENSSQNAVLQGAAGTSATTTADYTNANGDPINHNWNLTPRNYTTLNINHNMETGAAAGANAGNIYLATNTTGGTIVQAAGTTVTTGGAFIGNSTDIRSGTNYADYTLNGTLDATSINLGKSGRLRVGATGYTDAPITHNGTSGGVHNGALTGTGVGGELAGLVTLNGNLDVRGVGGATGLIFSGGIQSSADQSLGINGRHIINTNAVDLNAGTIGFTSNGTDAANASEINVGGVGVNDWNLMSLNFGGYVKMGADNVTPVDSGIKFGFVNDGYSTGTFDLNGFDQTVASLSHFQAGVNGDNTITDTGGTGTLTVNQSTNTEYRGNFEGGLSLVKDGADTLTLNNQSGTASNSTGTTTINAGILEIQSGVDIGDSSVVTLANIAGASLNVAGTSNNETIGGLSGGGTTGGNVNINTGNTLNVANAAAASDTYAGVIAGLGGLTKAGDATSTQTLTGTNTYTGATSIEGGKLLISGDNASTEFTVGSGSTLELASGFTIKGASNGSTIIKGDGALLVSGNVSGQADSLKMQMNSGASIDVQANITYGNGGDQWTGNLADLNVDGGIYGAANDIIANSLTGNGSISMGSGTIVVGVDDGDGIFNGNLSRNYADAHVRKEGSGTQTVTGSVNMGANGTVTVSEGTLIFNGISSGTSATGTWTVENGGTLAGSGTLSGTATIGDGATLSPGNSPGTQTFDNLTWVNGGTYLWEINADSLNGGSGSEGADPGWDWIDVTNNFDLSGINTGFNIDITSLTTGNIAGLADGFDYSGKAYLDPFESFTILSFGSLTGTFDASEFNLLTGNFANSKVDWNIDIVGNDLVLNAVFVPEPSSTALLGLGGLALMLRRKRS